MISVAKFIPSMSSVVSVAQGSSPAIIISTSKKNEDTIRAGKNYVLCIPLQIAQWSMAMAQFNKTIATLTIARGWKWVLYTVASSSVTLYICPLSIAAYCYQKDRLSEIPPAEGAAAPTPSQKYINFIRYANTALSIIKVPKRLHFRERDPIRNSLYDRTIRTFLDRSSNYANALFIICTVGQYIAGMRLEATSALIILGISTLDRRGMLNERVSIFYNKNLNYIAIGINIVLGTPFEKVMSTISLICYLAPAIRFYFGDRMERWRQRSLAAHGVHYPTLNSLEPPKPARVRRGAHVEAPPVVPPKPTLFTAEEIFNFDGIQQLLVNPAHVRNPPQFNPSTRNINYEMLLTHWDRVNWSDENSFNLITNHLVRFVKGKIKLDEKWGDHITKQSPADKALHDQVMSMSQFVMDEHEAAMKAVPENAEIKPILDVNAVRNAWKMSPQYEEWKKSVITWSRQQLNLFIMSMNGAKQPDGDLSGMNAIRDDCKKVIFYMNELQTEVEKEGDEGEKRAKTSIIQDFLVRFALDGGDYCVTGIEQATRLNLDDVIRTDDKALSIEERISANAQIRRDQWIQNLVALIPNTVKKIPFLHEAMGEMFSDIHSYNELILYIGQGIGLNLKGAKSDKTVQVSPFLETFFPVFFPQFRNAFWRGAYEIRTNETETLYLPDGQVLTINKGDMRKIVAFKEETYPNAVERYKNSRTVVSKVKAVWNLYSVISLFGYDLLRCIPKQEYNDLTLMDVVRELYGRTIKAKDIQEWWDQYILRLSNGNKELQQKLTNYINGLDEDFMPTGGEGLFTKSVEGGKTKLLLTEKFLKIMLIEMNMLQKPRAPGRGGAAAA